MTAFTNSPFADGGFLDRLRDSNEEDSEDGKSKINVKGGNRSSVAQPSSALHKKSRESESLLSYKPQSGTETHSRYKLTTAVRDAIDAGNTVAEGEDSSSAKETWRELEDIISSREGEYNEYDKVRAEVIKSQYGDNRGVEVSPPSEDDVKSSVFQPRYDRVVVEDTQEGNISQGGNGNEHSSGDALVDDVKDLGRRVWRGFKGWVEKRGVNTGGSGGGEGGNEINGKNRMRDDGGVEGGWYRRGRGDVEGGREGVVDSSLLMEGEDIPSFTANRGVLGRVVEWAPEGNVMNLNKGIILVLIMYILWPKRE